MEFRCSKLARVMECPGSPFFNIEEEEAGEPAREGTAAGEYLEKMLRNGTTDEIPEAVATNGVPFDRDMRFHTVPIALDIFSKAQTKILCEQRIDWQTRSGIWIRGQYDASYVHNGMLYIDDLKYGWGLVENNARKPNWQLLGYAIGEVIRRQTPFPTIVLRIHQPRPHHEDGHTREWRLTYLELLEWKEKIESRMDAIAAGDRTLKTGSHCKYCPAVAEACPAFNRAFQNAIDHITSDHIQDTLSDKEIAFQLDLIDRASDILDIKQKSLHALAINRIKNGAILPGYATTQSYGDRKWKPGISPKTIEVLTGKKIVVEEMLSPAQAEKMGVPAELVNGLVDRYFKGMKLQRKDANAEGDKIFGKGPPK